MKIAIFVLKTIADVEICFEMIIKKRISKKMLYDMFFNLAGIKKSALYLHRYPENNLFTLKKN